MTTLAGPVDLIKKSFNVFFKKENFIYFLKIYSISFILSLVSLLSSSYTKSYTKDFYVNNFSSVLTSPNIAIIVFFIILLLIAVLVGLWAQVASYEAVKRVVMGEKLEFKDTFKTAWKYILRFFTVNFFVGLIVTLGFVLLIIPGIIFMVWYSFANWNVLVKNDSTFQAMKDSKNMIKGKFWAVLGRILVFGIFSFLVSIVISIVPYGSLIISLFGGLFILPYFLLYRELNG